MGGAEELEQTVRVRPQRVRVRVPGRAPESAEKKRRGLVRVMPQREGSVRAFDVRLGRAFARAHV